MRFVCFITVLVLFNRIYAQDYSIKAGFRDLPFKSVYLAEMEGEKYKIIDSVTTNFMGNFTFKIKKNQHIGQYRLLTLPEKKSKSQEKKIILDFLFNKENIEFLTDSQAPTDSMRDVKSVENEIYFQYVKLRNDNKYKADVLKHFLTNYPKDDDFYIKANEKYSQLQVEINQYIDKVIKKEPKTYIARMLKMEKNILPDTKLGEEQQNEYLKIHYFDGFDFNDTSLVYSNAITNKIVGYLGLFREKPYNRDKQEIAFIRAVDNIMKATKQNKKVYEFILDYIISGFEKFEFEKVINYIADNSRLEDLCVNEDDKSTLEIKIESYKKLAIGKEVPDFEILCSDKNKLKLSDLNKKYVLILFWASWCTHCEVFIPELKKYYESELKNNLDILAISVDEDEKLWRQAVDKNKSTWYNCAELKGWNGKIVKEYCVYATPTLILIDKDRKIIAKPMSIDEIKIAIAENP